MEEIYEFLKACGDYFLATCDDGQPRVRPFGTVNIYNGRLYIQTGKSKSVSRQLHKNPKLEICAMLDGGATKTAMARMYKIHRNTLNKCLKVHNK